MDDKNSKNESPPSSQPLPPPQPPPDESKWNNLSYSEKFKYFWSSITVEPMLALCILPMVLSGLATQNLNLDKACRVNLNYDPHICDALMRRDTANYTM